jgi:ribonuclease E
MAKRMLIDATHPEETRVVVLNGNRLEEFDFESSTKKQIKGNIYLAKITRVEPSLQAAFVDYGHNRHGFLAFSEIHPDYYKIPVDDRESGGVEHVGQEPETREVEPEIVDLTGISLATALPEPVPIPATPEVMEDDAAEAEPSGQSGDAANEMAPPITSQDREARLGEALPEERRPEEIRPEEIRPEEIRPEEIRPEEIRPEAAPVALPWEEVAPTPDIVSEHVEPISDPAITASPVAAASVGVDETSASAEEFAASSSEADGAAVAEEAPTASDESADPDDHAEEGEVIETIGGDELEEAEHQRSRTIRHYKIQEVIKRRQIMLVQVSKEERGNKGAALTTYLSLAGRYCVLMPNTARGGGVSRKITSVSDRRRLKDILEELDIPEGMGVIVRTAGAERSKAEIKRDYEYLLRLWNEIRDLTLRSTAPALIYEEGSLIKRSIRDLYTRDIDEVLVEGEEGYRTAKAFMKMLMPSHAKRVQPYRDTQIGLLHRFQVESQIDAIHSPIVQLRSGGYVVINQTEALVAIDVNSGRSTRERNIEETAVRTNLEAAEEIARQLRLRDLAGLIVIDFIDMEEHRNQSAVERRLKEALKSDRARIQVGRISPFGLLEMSRQRLRPSLVEASTQPCPHCGGTGSIRSTESTALYVLRSIEEEGMRRRSAEICVYVPTAVALYILNQKRESLVQLEARYGMQVLVARDDALIPPAFRLERLRAYGPAETVASPTAPLTQTPILEEEEDEVEEAVAPSDTEHEDQEERGRGRRRRRRRRHPEEEAVPRSAVPESETVEGRRREGSDLVAENGRADGDDQDGDQDDDDAERRRRRRGRRGGRRRAKREPGIAAGAEGPRPASDTVEILPAHEVEEAEPQLVEARASWPVEVSAGIETASLAALAGEPAGDSATIAAANESGRQTAVPGDSVAFETPHPQPIEETAGAGGASRAVAPPTAESEQGVPYVSETERILETASPALEPEPAHPVETVSEKPGNPRRGWWQRLIQP